MPDYAMIPAQTGCVIEPIGGAERLAGSGTADGPTHWQIWLAALFVALALAGCASVAAGPGQAPNVTHQEADPRDTSGRLLSG
jgi:hypothetical protein